jgi:small GTP-binding protein
MLFDKFLKLVIVGDEGTGKTTLFRRFIDDSYSPENSRQSQLVEFDYKIFQFDNISANLTIWAVPGQDRYRIQANSYYGGADAVLLCYDVTKRRSFEGISGWIKEA